MIEIEGLGYRYPRGTAPALRDVTLEVAAGERLLVTGPSGCGKSTFLRMVAGLLQRHGLGESVGVLRIGDVDPADLAPSRRPSSLGWVGQVPGDQLIAGTAGDELAFGLESAGWEPEAIEVRVAAVGEAVDIGVDLERDPRTLSGGEQQRLAIGAALSAEAAVLLLDEPLAQLDGRGAERVLELLGRLADRGTTVVLVEHRLEQAWAWADRVVRLEDGQVVEIGPPASVNQRVLADAGLQVPGEPLLQAALDEGWRPQATRPVPEGETVLVAEQIHEVRDGRTVLKVDRVELRDGARVAVLGANGAGKSTLLEVLARAGEGVVDVPQDPDLALFTPSVREELASAGDGSVSEVAKALRLSDVLERAPQSLSRGQRLRVAVGAALAARPRVLLLDEPTSGQDRDAVRRVVAGVREAGCAVVFATHDVDLALDLADEVWVLAEGRLVDRGPPGVVLARLPEDSALRLPQVARRCLAEGLPLVSTDAVGRR